MVLKAVGGFGGSGQSSGMGTIQLNRGPVKTLPGRGQGEIAQVTQTAPENKVREARLWRSLQVRF